MSLDLWITVFVGSNGSGSSLNSNMAPQVAAPLNSGPHFEATHLSKHEGKLDESVSEIVGLFIIYLSYFHVISHED